MSKSKVVGGGKVVGKSKTVGASKEDHSVPVDMPKRKLEIVDVLLADLILWEDNPRKNDAAAKKLAKIIAAHGFNSPIVCSRDNIIRKGNTSYKAACILGLETVPVIYIDFPSEEMARMYSIADNRASELSEWDPLGLAKLLGERSSIPIAEMETLTGFSQPEILGLRDGWEQREEKKGTDNKASEKVIRCPYCSKEFSLDE